MMKAFPASLLSHLRLKFNKRFLKFALVGASGTVVDFGIVVWLSHLFQAAFTKFLIRNFIQITAYETSVVTNYLLSFFWVWKDRRGHFWKNFIKYNISTALAFGIRLLVFNLGIYISGVRKSENLPVYYLVYFLSVGIAMVINYLIINYKVFKKGAANEA